MNTTSSPSNYRPQAGLVLILALLLVPVAYGCIYGSTRLPEKNRTLATVALDGWSLTIQATQTGTHYQHIDGSHGCAPRVGSPFDELHNTVTLRVAVQGVGRHIVGTVFSTKYGEHEVSAHAHEQFAALSVEQCIHQTRRLMALRITHTSTSGQAGPAPQGASPTWQTVYAFPSLVTMSGEPITATTCEEALAKASPPEEWIAQELRHDNRAEVVVRGPRGLTLVENQSRPRGSVGYIAAVSEKVHLPEAVDWLLEHPHNARRLAGERSILQALIQEGPAATPDLEAHLLGRLMPEPGLTGFAHVRSEDSALVYELLASSPRQERLTRAAFQVAEQCLDLSHQPECTAWRLSVAGRIAGQLGDRALCDRLLDVYAAYLVSPELERAGASADQRFQRRAYEGQRLVTLLRHAKTCASPARFKEALLTALTKAQSVDFHHPWGQDCTPSAEGDPLSSCHSPRFYAAAHVQSLGLCAEERLARPLLMQLASGKGEDASAIATELQDAAVCILGICHGRQGLEEGLAASTQGRGPAHPAYVHRLVEQCRLDPAFIPPRGKAR